MTYGVHYKFIDRLRDNDVMAVKLFIDAGINVNANIENGYTALMYAAEKGYLEIAKLLIENGSDANATNRFGESVLTLADFPGNEKIVNFLKKPELKNEKRVKLSANS